MRPDVGSSKPPIMRNVVVLPQPEGPRSAKKLPRSISSETSSTAMTSSNRFVTWSRRTSTSRELVSGPALATTRSSTATGLADLGFLGGVAVDAGAPVVELLPEVEVEKGLGRDDAWERADLVR